MGKSSNTPPPQDYRGAAKEDYEGNRKNLGYQTNANRADQINPFGSSQWSKQMVFDPTTGSNVDKWTQTNTLNPELDAALQQQMEMTKNRSTVANQMTTGLMNDPSMYEKMDWDQFGEQQDYVKNGPMNLKGMGARDYTLEQGDTADAEQMQRSLDLSGAPQLDRQEFQQDLDYSGANNVGTGAEQRQSAEDAIYDRGASRLDRRMQQGGEDLEVKLRGQGLQPGDQAYDRAMRDFNENKTDAYQTLANESIMGGGKEASRTFGMDMDRRGMMTGEQDRMGNFRNQALSGQFGLDAQRRAQSVGETGMMGDFANNAAMGQFGMNQSAADQRWNQQRGAAEFRNQARNEGFNERLAEGNENRSRNREWIDQQNRQRQQAINEATQQRAQGMNEVTAWMNGQQVNAPQFQQYNQAQLGQGPQYLQAMGMQGQQNAANQSAQNAGYGGMMSGLGSMAGAAMMMSDRRLKKNIKRIGTKAGHPWYSFRYVWGVESEGVMADEISVEHKTRIGDYDMVNYGTLIG